MSDADEPARLRRTFETATPPYRGHGDTQMDAVGAAIALGIVVLLVPLLPFAIVVYLLLKLADLIGGRRGRRTA